MTLAEIRTLTQQLTSQEKAQLISELAADLAQNSAAAPKAKQVGSLYGIAAGWGPSVTEEDIAEMRREAWGEYVEGNS
jgi:hypothetical protein